MGGIAFISTCLRAITDGWNLLSKAWSLRPKTVSPQIHDEASFLALLDAQNKKSVYHVDTRKHYYEFMVYVDQVIFQQRLLRRDLNMIVFRFSKQDNHIDRQEVGWFGKRLRAQAMMLREGDQIIIRGYFDLTSPLGVIRITEIERL